MGTLYGLTEAQMWDVYQECQTKMLEHAVKAQASIRKDCCSLGDGDFGEIASYAFEMWDRSKKVPQLELTIADCAINGWLSVRNEEE